MTAAAATSERLPLVYRCVPTSEADLAAVVRMLRGMPVPFVSLRCVTLPGQPHPKGRPRFNRRTGNAYMDRRDKDAQDRTRAMLEDSGMHVAAGVVLVACLFFRADRRITDADNLEKHALDSAQGILFRNDSAVRGLSSFIDFDRQHPRTVMAIASVA